MDQPHLIHPLIKKELIDIYQSFARVCDAHGLKYWCAYGTLLGAVRHKGFIPWDDDFDVIMLREDYEKFIAVCERELPKHYKLVTIFNCKEYSANFCKIQETRREVYDRLEREADYVNPHGAYIDVFPLDGVPENVFSKLLDFVRFASAFCRTSYLWRRDKSASIGRRLFKFMGWLLGVVYPGLRTKRDFGLLYESWMKRTMDKHCSMLRRCNPDGRFQSVEYNISRAVFEHTIMIPFEGISIPAPEDFDTALRCAYGPNYMTPPPLDKQVSEHSKAKDCPWKYGPTGV